MPAFQDLSSRVFGRLTVLERLPRTTQTRWRCRCSCGTEKVVITPHLTSGRVQSCGCWARELSRQRQTKHGMRRTSEYKIYCDIVRRCRNSRSKSWKNYGGRGITVQWNSFDEFYAALGPRPSPQHTIDRYPDNDGPYSTINTRWATRHEQMNNIRKNQWLTFNGLTLTHSQWDRHLGFSRSVVSTRLRCGWTIEATLTTPLCHRRGGPYPQLVILPSYSRKYM